jgi:hypothetical protein
MTVNPFTYDEPLRPAELVDRDEERRQLTGLAEAGQNSRLVAPRRYGKTTLLGAVADDLSQDGMLAVYVDCSRTTALEDVVVRLRQAWRKALGGSGRRSERVWRELDRRVNVSVTLGVPGVGSLTASRPGQPASDAGVFEALHALLDAPLRLHETADKRSFIVLDEFHDLLTARDDLDGILRSHAQHQRGAAAYCFAGSQASAMRALFADRRRPLFEQAREVRLGALDVPALLGWLEDRFDNGGRPVAPEAIDRLGTLTAGHPQRAMMVAHFLWSEARRDAGGLERALANAIHEASDGLEQTWSALTGVQRRALSAAAEGHDRLLTKAALERAQVGKPTMQSARKSLLAEGHLLDIGNGQVRISDPFLGLWLAQGRRGD